MSGTEQVMAILLEAEDIQVVHKDWPEEMRLSMCLMPSGDCQILLFRQEEVARFPDRLRKHLGLRAEELSFHPKVEGYPVCNVSYSDERNLGALLADAPNLLEDANDYSVNYSYALEEGLDPVAFLGSAPAEPTVAADRSPVVQTSVEEDAPASHGAISFQSRRVKPEPEPAQKPLRNLTFDLQAEAARLEEPVDVEEPNPAIMPGQGFLRADHLTHIETPPGAYQLSYKNGWFELSRGEGKALVISDPTHLFMRDDHRLLAIHRKSDAMPNRIRLQAEVMPQVMQDGLRGAVGTVHLASEDGFFFVSLPKPTQAIAPSVDTLEQAQKKRPWSGVARSKGLRLLGLTSAATVGILLILTTKPNDELIGEQDRAIDWSQFRLSQAQP